MIKIARMTERELAVLGDLFLATGMPGRFDCYGNFSTDIIVENQQALQWTSTGPQCVKFWKGWLPTYRWTYENGVLRQFSRQNVAELLSLLPNAPDLIGEFNFCFGPATDGDITELAEKGRYTERLYAVYQAIDGDYYLAKGNATFTDWDSYERLVFVPSGAYHPSIAFDESGHFTVAAEFQPAGGEIELWIYQYPYTGDAIRVVVSGIYCRTPILFLDPDMDLLYFYGNSTNIRYRAKSENYAVEHTLPIISSNHIDLHTIRWFTHNGNSYGIIVVFIEECDKRLRYICTIKFRRELSRESADAEILLREIIWEAIENWDRNLGESSDAIINLQEIVWEKNVIIQYYLSESGNAMANLCGLSWIEITIIDKSLNESGSAFINLQNILWVEP